MLDKTDINILNQLLSNSRTSTTQIAKSTSISNVATQQRITKLENSDIIKGYTAKVNYHAIGYKTVAYLGIFLEKAKDYKNVLKALNKVSLISEAHFTTGTYSIFAKIYAKDNLHLMEVLSEEVQSIDGIARTETFISLHEGIHKEVMLGMV